MTTTRQRHHEFDSYCEICKMKLYDRRSLNRHTKRVHGVQIQKRSTRFISESGKYVCRAHASDREFKNLIQLRQHLYFIHWTDDVGFLAQFGIDKSMIPLRSDVHRGPIIQQKVIDEELEAISVFGGDTEFKAQWAAKQMHEEAQRGQLERNELLNSRVFAPMQAVVSH